MARHKAESSRLTHQPRRPGLARARTAVPFCKARVVGLGRIELPTSPLSGVRSSHLSYRPVQDLVELIGIEPTAS